MKKNITQLKTQVDDPLIISIVTPSFNQGSYLGYTIDSVISQEGNFYIDYIIIDGGSSDNSVEVIKKTEANLTSGLTKGINNLRFFLPNHKNGIKCLGVSFRWISEKDNGHVDGINKGFKLAQGSILAWINSDDMYHKKAFQKILKIFNQYPKVEWIIGRSAWWGSKNEVIHSKLILRNIYDFLTGRFGWIQQESTFWRKSLWQKTGASLSLNHKYVPDGELWSKFFLKASPYFYDQLLGGYRLHGTNAAHKHQEQLLAEMNKVLQSLYKRASLIVKINIFLIKVLRKLSISENIFLINLYLKQVGYNVINEKGQILKMPYKLSKQSELEISQTYEYVNQLSSS